MVLSEKIQDPAIRQQIAADCATLVDQQVSTKKGISGMAVKAAYGVIKGIGASYIPGAIERLLPEACSAIDPLWTEGVAAGDPVTYLSNHSTRTADSLLGVTDARLEQSDNTLVCGTYRKLRKSIQGDVEAAVPGLARIISNYA